MERGLVYIKGAIGNPEYAKNASVHFDAANQLLLGKGVHDPMLSYCLGLCAFYFDFDLHKATALFEDAGLHLQLEGDKSLIAKCYYELGKLYHLKGMEEKSLLFFQKAALENPELMEARFQFLRMLVLTKGDTGSVHTLLTELEEFNCCYVLKLVSEKTFRENPIIIEWLVDVTKKQNAILADRLAALRRRYAKVFDKNFYTSELRKLEVSHESNQYFTALLTQQKAEQLEYILSTDVQASFQTIEELKARYLDYEANTWKDSPQLPKLSQYIRSQEENLGSGTILTALTSDYDDTDLQQEIDRRKALIVHYEKKYGITLEAVNKATLGPEIKEKMLKRNMGKLINAYPWGGEDKEGGNWSLMQGVVFISAVVFIIKNWDSSDYSTSSTGIVGGLIVVFLFIVEVIRVLVIGLFKGVKIRKPPSPPKT